MRKEICGAKFKPPSRGRSYPCVSTSEKVSRRISGTTFFAQHAEDPFSPFLQRIPFLIGVAIAIVDCRNARNCPGAMVQHFSITCGAMPSRAIPDAAVLRRS